MNKVLTLILCAVGLILTAAEIELGGTGRPMVSPGIGPKRIEIGAPAAMALRGVLVRDDGLAVESRDWDGKALYFDVPEFGYYELTVAAADGTVAKSNYAVIPFVPERPSEMGACVHFAQGKGSYPLTFDLLTLAGFTRVRDDLSWESVERERGVYNVPEPAAQLVTRCEEYGIRPLFVFGYPNSRCYPDGFDGKPFPTDDRARQGCAGAMAFVVGHFGDRVTEWELWNEPNYADPVKDYLPLLKFVYPAVKAANPGIELISGGGSGAGGGPGGGFIWPIFDAGAQDWQDGWSVHPYMAPHEPDFGYAAGGSPIPRVSIPVFAPHLKNMARTNPRSDGKALSLWITELGWSTSKISDLDQAAYLARMYLLFRREAASPGVFWYDFQNDGDDPNESEHNFGIIRTDYTPKPAYQAAAVAASLLGNRPFIATLVDGEEKVLSYGYAGREEFFAAWTVKPEGATIELDWPAGRNRLALIDWQGREMPVQAADSGKLKLDLSILPQYLIVKD